MYEKQTWASGDVITAEKLNHIEDGVADKEVLKITFTGGGDNVTTDVTAAEAEAAWNAGKTIIGYCSYLGEALMRKVEGPSYFLLAGYGLSNFTRLNNTVTIVGFTMTLSETDGAYMKSEQVNIGS